ncbi:thiosulfate reductase cytochrome b subunit [Microbacterium trichothecenolyticum]|uniref:cytochrome b/b6 domain-containing protein n=1 Tax=Microbacterium trichothecenolyticum TaxID=69370 RepID=UPI00285FFE2F|nr:cytochrome b/b6 domain-containing protein [Microbacterium trichothecenolyticum]MDR7183690.1 thiosulfate reductase cytochrome b subunit [Microbacterium trichothecenolyticum]
MATFGSTVRRGLPRVPGGEPWPPAGAAPGTNGNGAAAQSPLVERVETPPTNAQPDVREVPAAVAATSELEHAGPDAATLAAATPEASVPEASVPGARAVRRGLPRVPGGEPWPPASVVPAVAAEVAAVAATETAARPEVTPSEAAVEEKVASVVAATAGTEQEVTPSAAGDGAKALRRGLPRVAGGEPWPPAGLAPTATAAALTEAAAAPAAEAPTATAAAMTGAAATPAAEAPTVAAAEVAAFVPELPVVANPTGIPLTQPLPFRRTVWAGATAKTHPAVKAAEPKRIGPFTRGQWAGAVIVGGAGLLYAAAMAVFAVRWLLSTQWGVDFLAAYPGEYHLPEGAPVGVPAWLGWQHFFNVFLMVLIIRTGLQVRTEKRPTVFWSPRSNGRRKMSLNLWFHQSLDILWIVNGVIFVVLLFVTGQWMKIVPTSWEVFPNAISAGLQYVSLDWPTENGWVNYNSLQQLAYFATVFLAAPLAIATGVRMSHVWPKNAAGLNKAYPVEWARAVHFPVMLYFVVFIAVHVFLVFATGALRNLNHMYASQGSVDPNAYADNWTGFWFFVASLVVIVAAWVAARPLVLAPIARLFGKVSGR